MSFRDDELDNELRRLFDDDRLDLSARPDADQAVLAGVKRIRRRRALLGSAGGAAAVVAVLITGITLTSGSPVDERPPVGLGPESSPTSTTPHTSPTKSPPRTPTETAAPDDSEPNPQPPPGDTSRPEPTSVRPVPAPVLVGTSLGPAGFGRLLLGMSAQEAIATGGLEDGARPPTGCQQYRVRGDSRARVMLSPNTGLEAITAGPKVRTPNGIGPGATRAEVRTAYPGAAEHASDLSVTVPGNPAAEYQFRFRGSDPNVLSHLVMVRYDRECVS